MNIHSLLQGSPEWSSHRALHRNASDAPAMMGCSPYKTRSQFLHECATGCTGDVDAATQHRFDEGHRFEALCRPLAEEIIGDDLYPITGTRDEFSASLDGRTMCGKIIWEHKTLNDAIRAAETARDLPLYLRVQMEHQYHVAEAEKCLFQASKWDADGNLIEEKHFWYESDPDLRAQVIAGWIQFAIDLDEYQPVEILPAAVAAPVMDLPALSVNVNGALTVNHNLVKFGDQLQQFIERINMHPDDDQGFADAEQAIKVMEKAELALGAAEDSALAQVADVDKLCKTVSMYREQARKTRLALEKMVKSRKDAIRLEIQSEATEKARQHIAGLDDRIGRPYMPVVPTDFAGVMKNKRTIASLRDAVNTELARFKIAANEVADRIDVNMKLLRENAEHAFLFADEHVIVQKAPDDLAALVKLRIAEHKHAEEERLEEEHAKIRAEEQAKVEAEQQQRVATEVKAQLEAQAVNVAAQRKGGGFTPLKQHLQESNSTHFRVVTDAEIIDMISEVFDLTRAEAIDRLASINFEVAREAA